MEMERQALNRVTGYPYRPNSIIRLQTNVAMQY